MKNLTDIFLKARSGVYKDTSENRRLHRVGQKYGESKQPEDDEKGKKEVDPAKELEAVNKVIEAINNKKMTLPPDQIMVLIEKKNKLELAKKQAEKINAGVKANEEKRNVKEVKETNEKINEASERTKKYGESSLQKFSEFLINDVKKMINIDLKSAIEGSSRKMGGGIIVDLTKLSRNDNSSVRQYLSKKGIKTLEWDAKRTYILYKDFEASERKKKYGDMNVEEAKKELLGKDLTITDIETGKTRTEKITSILEGNVRGHETVMARVEGGGTYPIKHIDTGKEWKAWKLNLNSSSKETKSEPKKERVTLDGWVSNSFSDVKDYGDKGRVVSMSVSAVPDFEKMKYVYVAVVGSSHVLPEDADKFLKESNDLNKKTFDSPNEAAKAADEFAAKWNKKEVKQVEVEDVKKKKSSLKEELDHQNNELDNLEEKEELDEDGELVTITHDKDKFKRYRLYRDLRSARMKRGTSPELAELGYLKNSGDINKKGIEKYFELQKEFGDKKYDFKEKSGEEPKEETKESFTRVKFDDLPNSGKVNLKKYLSDKVKRTADENLGILSKVSTENLKKMEAGLVKEFNSQFDDLPKSRRAEKLYSIMKVKAELAQRGNKG